MQPNSLGKSAANGAVENAASVATSRSTQAGLGDDQHVANRVRCPHHAALEKLWNDKRTPTSIQRGTHELLDVITHCTSEAWSRCGAWVGSIPASDVRLGLLGVVKASARTALPVRKRFEAEALDEVQATVNQASRSHGSEHMRQRTKTKTTTKKRKH